ncbi:hypothetical protein ANACOL_01059 [Anaerotruncus colihominis DSM 17241]|uniref:Uncharacterized protein n=1 Tax=Anaerotruncus colihominis DSM 17241 TaxID=445972 RepID=B0P8H0_9FIRM|nr:hypothetical protein ANACOL_01059 [Anaerotruncus colihominis DSM 17241]
MAGRAAARPAALPADGDKKSRLILCRVTLALPLLLYIIYYI